MDDQIRVNAEAVESLNRILSKYALYNTNLLLA